MNYKLKKDLPDLKAGAVFIKHESLYGYICENSGSLYSQKEIEDTEWFEPVPERIELELYAKFPDVISCLRRVDHSLILEKDRLLMEQAINGELFNMQEIFEANKEWYNNRMTNLSICEYLKEI